MPIKFKKQDASTVKTPDPLYVQFFVDSDGVPKVKDSSGTIRGTSFTIASDINPLHWWRADNTVQSGGLVDTIVDNGSSPLNFTQTGAARAPTAVDGNSKTYLALDGANDFYQSGAVSDWKYLNDGSPFTIAIIYHRNALITAPEMLLDTTNFTSGSTGFCMFLDFVSSTVQGIRCFVSNGVGGTSPIGATSRVPSTSLTCLVVRYFGDSTNHSAPGFVNLPIDLMLRRHGALVATCAKNANTFNNISPSFTMTLGRQSNSAGAFTSARIYETLIDNKAWSDRQILGFETYARTTYSVPGM